MSAELWKCGRCFSMHGCGWAQRGSDSDTYRHFGTYRAAADFVREENKVGQRAEILAARADGSPSGKEQPRASGSTRGRRAPYADARWATRADGMMGVHWSPDQLCQGSGRPPASPSGKERGE